MGIKISIALHPALTLVEQKNPICVGGLIFAVAGAIGQARVLCFTV